MALNNLVLHIAIPKGLKLVTGATLYKDVTMDFISALTPYYASVDLVRLAGGPVLSKMSDIAIACMVYDASLKADLISPEHVQKHGHANIRFIGARMQWVITRAARDMLQNIVNMTGANAHVLANFSVDRKADTTLRLDELKADLALWEVAVRSGGRTMPGGRPRFVFAAKGVNDWSEQTPGRGWSSLGVGANAKTMDAGSATGGRGKPVSFFASPLCSPPFWAGRSGMYQPGYPMAQLNPGSTFY